MLQMLPSRDWSHKCFSRLLLNTSIYRIWKQPRVKQRYFNSSSPATLRSVKGNCQEILLSDNEIWKSNSSKFLFKIHSLIAWRKYKRNLFFITHIQKINTLNYQTLKYDNGLRAHLSWRMMSAAWVSQR